MSRAALASLALTCSLLAGACARGLAPEARALLAEIGRAGALPPEGEAPAASLAPLATRLDAARVIGVGRPLAGGREFGVATRRLFFTLVERHGVTGLVLDVDFQLGLRLDAWARGQTGDLDALTLELDEPALRNAEARALLAEIRAYNDRPERRVTLRIHGVDPGEPEPAVAATIAFLNAVDPDFAPRARGMFESGDGGAIAGVLRRFDERGGEYISRTSESAYGRARMQAEVAAQGLERAETWAFDAPEFHRAKNLDAALRLHGPQGRLFLWAENRRTAAAVPGNSPSMGEYLRRWHGPGYVAIGGVFVAGRSLLELDGSRLCPVDLPPAPEGSFDAAFAGLAGPALVPVAAIVADPRLARALRSRPQIRAIEGPYEPAEGLRYTDLYGRLDAAFDALLVAPTVTPAAPAPGLGRADERGCVEIL